MADPPHHINLASCTRKARQEHLGAGGRSPPSTQTVKHAPQHKISLRRQLRVLQFRQLQKFPPSKEGGGVVVVAALNLKGSDCGWCGVGKASLARVRLKSAPTPFNGREGGSCARMQGGALNPKP